MSSNFFFSNSCPYSPDIKIKDVGDDNGDELDVDLTDDPLDVVAKVLGLVPPVALVGVLLCHLAEVFNKKTFLDDGLERTEDT